MSFRLSPTRLASALGLLLGLGLTGRAADIPHPIHQPDTDRFHFEPSVAEHDIEAFITREQSRLDDKGVHLFGSFWGDFMANPVGGQSQSAAWAQLLIVGATIDLHKTVGWPPGGSVTASLIDVAGSNISNEIGNAFAVPQAYMMNTFALYDLYYQQQLFDGKLTLTAGRMMAGQFFATLPAMTMVVSAAVNGNPVSLFANAMYPSITSATWGTYAKVKPTADTYIDAGVFQASPRNGLTSYHGADFSIRPDDGILMIAEVGWTPSFKAGESAPADGKTKAAPLELPGIYTFGAYLTNYPFSEFDGSGIQRNAYGFYWLAQQMVWRSRNNPLHNVSLWGGVTYSPQQQIAPIPIMGLGGVILQGFVPTRDSDSILFSVYAGGFSPSYAAAQDAQGQGRPTAETVIELSYIIQLTPHIQIQPDVQYILQPGGAGPNPDAVVLGGQFSISF